MKVLSGTGNVKLSKEIAKRLKVKLINANIKRFSDGEIYVEINENIRGNSIFVF
jgi:ribose-phosphate pyrophosphokinase